MVHAVERLVNCDLYIVLFIFTMLSLQNHCRRKSPPHWMNWSRCCDQPRVSVSFELVWAEMNSVMLSYFCKIGLFSPNFGYNIESNFVSLAKSIWHHSFRQVRTNASKQTSSPVCQCGSLSSRLFMDKLKIHTHTETQNAYAVLKLIAVFMWEPDIWRSVCFVYQNARMKILSNRCHTQHRYFWIDNN